MKQFLDGPKVAAWLMAEIPALRPDHPKFKCDDNLTRYLHYWKTGRRVSVWKLDELLIRFDRHLWEIPDSYYVHEPHHRLRYGAELIQLALDRYVAGENSRDICGELDIRPSAFDKMRQRAGIPAHRKR